jgi:hypothetical protein
MITLKGEAGPLIFPSAQDLTSAISVYGDRRDQAGSITTSLSSKDALLEQRIILLERLAECADEIKRIDEQLKLV